MDPYRDPWEPPKEKKTWSLPRMRPVFFYPWFIVALVLWTLLLCVDTPQLLFVFACYVAGTGVAIFNLWWWRG